MVKGLEKNRNSASMSQLPNLNEEKEENHRKSCGNDFE